MDRSLLLAGISAAQLGAGLAGLAVAVRRRHPYAFLVLRGDPDRIALDAIDIGTALSAPGVMLVAQATATAHLLRRRASLAERILGALGAAMMVGYLGEDLVRRRLRRSNWDRLESPLIAVGFGWRRRWPWSDSASEIRPGSKRADGLAARLPRSASSPELKAFRDAEGALRHP